MQENEFEKKIRIKMNELQLVPDEDVWQKVSAEIHKEKRRKRFLLYLLAFTFLAGSTVFYFYINSNNILPALAVDNNLASGNTITKNPNSSIKSQRLDRSSSLSPKINDTITKVDAAESETKAEGGNRSGKKASYSKNIERSFVGATTAVSDKQVISKTPTVSNIEEADEPLKPVEQESIQPKDIIQAEVKADSTNEKSLEKPNAEIKKDSSKTEFVESKSKQPVKTSGSKKWQLAFTAFCGISNNISGIALFSGGGADNYSYASPSTGANNGNPQGPNNNTSAGKLNYKSRFSYGVGIYLIKYISKKIDVASGLTYHFASTSSLVGNKNTSTRTIYDAAFLSTAVVNIFYNGGQSVKYSNKYHLIELPLHVFFQLNKNQNKPISVIAGVSPAYLIGSKALYASSSQNIYYENSDQFKKLLLTIQSGIQFPILNASHFNVAAGPEIQYGLNNMAKTATATNQHIFSAGIKLQVRLQ